MTKEVRISVGQTWMKNSGGAYFQVFSVATGELGARKGAVVTHAGFCADDESHVSPARCGAAYLLPVASAEQQINLASKRGFKRLSGKGREVVVQDPWLVETFGLALLREIFQELGIEQCDDAPVAKPAAPNWGCW